MDRVRQVNPFREALKIARKGGDVGLVAHRLAALHRQGKPFDAEVDRRLLTKGAAFLKDFDRARDIGWIAERDYRLAGACLLRGVTRDTAEVSLTTMDGPLLDRKRNPAWHTRCRSRAPSTTSP